MVLLVVVCLWVACTPTPTPTPIDISLKCAPSDGSTLQYGDTATMSVVGAGTFTYEWTAARGTVNSPDASAIIYTTPNEPGADVISVKVRSGDQSWTFSCTYEIIPPSTNTPPPTPSPTLTSTPTPTLTPTPTRIIIGFQKGLAFPVWWYEHYCQSEFGLTAIRNIAELGADWVQLVPTWYQEDRNANEIKRVEDKTATDACLKRAIEAAHNNGLEVMLKPHVDSLDGYFRGEIAPSQPDAWFASYEKMILHYADIAHESEVEILVVGTELKSMSGTAYSERWRALIAEIRRRYFDHLTYAANWDAYDQIGFWSELDYVGIDAYFPLSNLDTPSREDILAGWQDYDEQFTPRHWADEIEALVLAVDRPLIFTEIGYASQDGAARQPWRGQQDEGLPANPELQTRLYEAALRTFWTQPYFKGFYWWFWDVQPDPLYEETGYMPKSLALQELQLWYGFTPPETPPTPTPRPMPSPPPPTDTLTPTLTPTPSSTPTSTPVVIAPSPSPAPRYDWESCTDEGWIAQTWVDSQGIESVAGSGEVAKTGACSLKLNARLQAGHENYSKGETYVQLPEPVSLAGKTITCWVYVPNDDATGPHDAYNGAQILVKDASWRNEYGSWLNLKDVGWVQVTLAPTTSLPPGGHMDPGFDPNVIIIVGVKIGTNSFAPSSYSYSGPFYVDSCTWSP